MNKKGITFKKLAEILEVELPEKINLSTLRRNMESNFEDEEYIRRVVNIAIAENEIINKISNLTLDFSQLLDVEKLATVLCKQDLGQKLNELDYDEKEYWLLNAQTLIDNINDLVKEK